MTIKKLYSKKRKKALNVPAFPPPRVFAADDDYTKL